MQILWRGARGSPDLLLGKAGALGSAGAVLRSCAVCIITAPLATGVAVGSLCLHYAAWRFRVLLGNHRTFSAVKGLSCACLFFFFFNMTRVMAI